MYGRSAADLTDWAKIAGERSRKIQLEEAVTKLSLETREPAFALL